MAGVTGDGQDHRIHARDVRPGVVIWNPYGGARGRALVASQPRERPDGAVEFDTADGRTGVFRPHFRLHFDRAATERLAAERDAKRPGQERRPPGATGPDKNSGPPADAETDFWAARAAQQRMQAEAEVDPGPAGRQLEGWNIHNDHADGLAGECDLDREA